MSCWIVAVVLGLVGCLAGIVLLTVRFCVQGSDNEKLKRRLVIAWLATVGVSAVILAVDAACSYVPGARYV